MPTRSLTPRLANIRLHPIKALDPVFVPQARIGPKGGLELDRIWALYSSDGRWVNGKRTPAMHLIRAEYSPDLSAVTLSIPGDRRNIPAMTFAFPDDTDGAALWFSTFFEQNIVVHYAREGFPDDSAASGPTLVSRESLETVCTWFPGMPLDEARRRFRTTLEVAGGASSDGDGPRNTGEADPLGEKLPPFWEDRLFGGDETQVVRFRIGEVGFEGSNPCARCPVPSRDSRSGEVVEGFQKRFSELRQAQLPAWAPAGRFDHFYRLATNTRVPSTEQGKLLRVGDEVRVG